jgi:hypothetical protein
MNESERNLREAAERLRPEAYRLREYLAGRAWYDERHDIPDGLWTKLVKRITN